MLFKQRAAEGCLKIKTQFLASIIFIIILSISSTAYVMVNDLNNALKQETNNKANLMIKSLRGVAVESFIKKDVLSLNYLIKELASTPGVIYIIVTDRFDTIVGTNNANNMGGETTQMYPEIKNPGEINNLLFAGRERQVINYTDDLSMLAKDKKLDMGKIYLGFDRGPIGTRILFIYLKAAAIAAGVMAISIILMLYLTGRIINPLNSLMTGTQKIAMGDMKYKIKVNVKNEFQALANAFNDMTGKLDDYYDGILNAFTIAVDSKNKYTPSHSKRVSRTAVLIAKAMKLTPAQTENIRIASILMDIGNLGVRESILDKTEVLTPEDLIQIQQHPEISARILKNIPALKDIVPIIMEHHERFDGMGYPAGLRGDQIMVEAKILSIADAYDAMVTEREHRKAMNAEEAIYELRANKNRQFDPLITEVFVEILNKEGVQ
jgi:HD-GYP domain-containing protein (c-di-GMP phosphodiesterase class II)